MKFKKILVHHEKESNYEIVAFKKTRNEFEIQQQYAQSLKNYAACVLAQDEI